MPISAGFHALPIRDPFPASVLRPPSPTATCSCAHWVHCDCACHGRHCDPTESSCDVAYLPDEGGLAWWGCPICTPGEGAPHFLGCELIGWSVPLALAAPAPAPGLAAPAVTAPATD